MDSSEIRSVWNRFFEAFSGPLQQTDDLINSISLIDPIDLIRKVHFIDDWLN